MNLNAVDNQRQLRATLNAARRANVTLYPVDPRGLAQCCRQCQPYIARIGMYTGAIAMST